MTKSQAIQQFFESFGISAYPVTAVPDDAVYPWLTYENSIGCKGDDPISISVDLWYHTESEKAPNAKVEQIAEAIGLGGKMIAYDGGAIWITRGAPWCISVSDADKVTKHKKMNINITIL